MIVSNVRKQTTNIMALTAISLTNGTLTVIIDNGAQIIAVRNDNPKWNELMDLFKQFDVTDDGKLAGPEKELFALLSLKSIVENYSVGQLSVNGSGVTYRGQPLHTVDSARVMAFLRDGLPYKPIANYMSRKMANPSARAINEMYEFLEHKNMPLTPDGNIIAYKGVRNDYYSVHGNTSTAILQGKVDNNGHILNSIGAVIEVERSSVDDNFRNGCSFGLHAGSLEYAKGWGERVVLVEIDPASVVSVPEDCNCQKLRCCKYKVIGEYTGPMPEAFTDEFSSDSNSDSEDSAIDNSQCDHCGSSDCNDLRCHLNDDECADDGLDQEDYSCDEPTPVVPTIADVSEALLFRCKELIASVLNINIDDLSENTLFSDIGITLLDTIELSILLETEFKIELSDEEMENICKTKAISDLVAHIYGKLNTQSTEIKSTNPDNRDRLFEGMMRGILDCKNQCSPVYMPGDVIGADSEAHKEYIKGYLKGYSSNSN
jgi:acyl carrier protein